MAKDKLTLEFTHWFFCDSCNKEKPVPEDNDWLFCCGKAMRMGMKKQYKVVPSHV